AEWQPGVERVTRPALVLWSRDDPYVAPRFAERLAERVRGELVLLDGCGHWWQYGRAAEAAAALEGFWAAPAGASARSQCPLDASSRTGLRLGPLEPGGGYVSTRQRHGHRGAPSPRRSAGGRRSLEEVGSLLERAPMGDGARGLQPVRRRVELLQPRPG